MQGVGVTDWVAPGERGLFPPSPKAKVPLLRCPLLLSVLVVGPLGGNRSFVGFFCLFFCCCFVTSWFLSQKHSQCKVIPWSVKPLACSPEREPVGLSASP